MPARLPPIRARLVYTATLFRRAGEAVALSRASTSPRIRVIKSGHLFMRLVCCLNRKSDAIDGNPDLICHLKFTW